MSYSLQISKRYRVIGLLMLFILFAINTFGQVSTDSTNNEAEEQKTANKKDIILDKRPRKATLLSTALPGLGQVYNRQYWKVPIIYIFMGAAGVFAYDNLLLANEFSNHYKNMIKSNSNSSSGFAVTNIYGKTYDLDGLSQDNIKFYRDQAQRQRDFNIILMLLVYTMNIIDANVYAHLKEFEINDNLTMKLKPQINFQTNTQYSTFGLALEFRLKDRARVTKQ